MDYILNIVRMIDFDQAKEFSFGDQNSLKKKLAISFLNPQDFDRLNISSGKNIKISNENGEIIVKVEKDEDVPQGMIQMPVSIWSNQLSSTKNGKIIYKNLKVNIEPTTALISKFEDLIKKIKGI